MVYLNSTIFEQNHNGLKSTLNFNFLNGIGIYLIFIFFLSFTFNTILIRIFLRNKKLRNQFNIYILAISFTNLIGSTVLPLIIHSSFSHRYLVNVFILINLK